MRIIPCVVIAKSCADAVNFCRANGIDRAALVYDKESFTALRGLKGFSVYRVSEWDEIALDEEDRRDLIAELRSRGAVFEVPES